MKIVALIGQKGGTGKTTTATALAVAASEDGKEVAVIDLDPQANAANWKDRRGGEDQSPIVVSAQVGRLEHVLKAARTGGADLAIIDTPGKLDAASIAAAKAADLVLIPMQPGVFDLETLQETRNLLHAANDPQSLVVLNGIHPTGKAHEDARGVIEGMGYRVADSCFARRAAFRDAPNSGQGPTDYEPDGKAADEVRELYKLIISTLKNLNIEVVK
jgi:chromosome partitioning protein